MPRFLQPVRMRTEAGHRTSTPLELLFDLCFVVAVAALAAQLHHDISHGHALDGAAVYAMLFVPIWWAWMSYTWFATAFDNDDAGFRLLTGAQMLGVLALAATIPAAEQGSFAPFTIAYTLMRLPLVVQWLRAAHDDPAHRVFALRYAGGTLLAQGLWLTGLFFPLPAQAVVWLIALTVDLGTPILAVRAAPGRVFHQGHIAERYGLFTIIVLGETIMAVSLAIRDSLAVDALLAPGLVIASAALFIAFALWWTYFDTVGAEGLTRNRRAAFAWGYGHYFLFAALAAIGAATQAQLELLAEGKPASATPIGAAVTISLLAMAWLQYTANAATRRALALLATAGAAGITTVLGDRLALPAVDLVLLGVLVAGIVADRAVADRPAEQVSVPA